MDNDLESFKTAGFVVVRIFGFWFWGGSLVDFDSFFLLFFFKSFLSDFFIDWNNFLILIWLFLSFLLWNLFDNGFSIGFDFNAGFGRSHRLGAYGFMLNSEI